VKNLPKVLVVDDEQFNLDYLTQELEDLGLGSITAKNGEEALRIMKAQNPDLVLLDIMMPVMDGFEVLGAIKKDKNLQDIPVIVISALSDMAHIVKGIELGAEDFLPKPSDPVLLQARIHSSLEKKRLRDIEKHYFQGLEKELQIGKQIQEGFLPEKILQVKGWEISTFFRSAREVSGDFFDVFRLPSGGIALFLGDVTGKGVGAALYMALYRTLLRASLEMNSSLGMINDAERLLNAATFTNRYICKVHDSNLLLTTFLGVLDPKSGNLEYVSAGHDPPMRINQGKIIGRLMPTGPVIGVLEDTQFEIGRIVLEREEILLLFTDGITDMQNREGIIFGPDNFEKLASVKVNSASHLLSAIVQKADDFIGTATQYDDITLLAVKRKDS